MGRLDTPDDWRLTSQNGIPYRFRGAEGSFEANQGNVTYQVLIPANRLIEFLEEIFPFATTFGNLALVASSALPGLPNLRAKRMTFKSFDDALPIDPFGFDPNAPSGTYFHTAQVDIEYGPQETQEPDQNDPFTFLEISASASADILHTTAPSAKWQGKTNDDAGADDDEEPGAWIDANNDGFDDNSGAVHPRLQEPAEPNKDPTVPIGILVPMTEWSIRWNQIPFDVFSSIIIHRVRFLMGRVNSVNVPWLFNALPETLLFAGYSYSNSFTWRSGQIGTPPVNLEMKIIEKRVVSGGVIRGHNDFWKPDVGTWETLLIDGTNKTFRSWDFNRLFKQ